MAFAINRTEEGNKYQKLHQDIALAFQNAFLNKTDGKLNGDTQTAYLQAVAMEMLPKEFVPMAIEHLAKNIEERSWHLTTGFVGRYTCISFKIIEIN